MNDELTSAQTDELIDVLLDSPDMGVFLSRLVHIASREVGRGPEGGHCSVTVLRERRPVTVCSSDSQTALMDELQYESRQGPCLEAVTSGQVIEVVDFSAEQRWPRYVRAMTGKPMRSVLAVPVPLMSSGRAALNCYSSEVGPVPKDVKSSLTDLVAVAARAVSLSVKLQTQAEATADLNAAMESRTVIDLASGVIMAQTECSQQEAVKILMKASSHRNVKLRDVALMVVSRFDGKPSTPFDLPS